jgi:large subunit ribosomal protein L10
MKLTREGKQQKSAEFATELKGASQMFFSEYQGLKFQNLADLRAKLRPLGLRCRVVKNSIALHAVKQAGIDGANLDDIFKGPVAMISGPGADPASAAKVLFTFAKEFPQLKLKAGFLEKRWFSPAECEQLSKLGSKQEILSKLLGLINQPAVNVLSVLQAPARDVALVVKAYEQKLAKEKK